MSTTATASAGGSTPRKKQSAAQIVQDSDLPPMLGELVLAVTGKARLWKNERAEIARELVSHFQEALADGGTPSDIAASFGDPARTAKLMTRAKKRNRSWFYQLMRRAMMAFAACVLLLIAGYVVLYIRYHSGKVVISKDYLAEFNAPSLAVPIEERAWPVYREAYLLMPRLGKEPWVGLEDVWPHVEPGDKQRALFERYVAESQPTIVKIRAAAGMARAGYIASTSDPNDGKAAGQAGMGPTGSGDPGGLVEMNGKPSSAMIGVLLPQLAAYRHCAKHLYADATVALDRKDRETVMADLRAFTGLSRHAAEDRTLIAQLVGMAIHAMRQELVVAILDRQPEFFTDDDLRTLAHDLAAYRPSPGGPREQVDLSIEQYMVDDLFQRVYTDDGQGDGHFVGMTDDFLRDWGLIKPKGLSLISPVTSAAVANRAESKRVFQEIMNAYAAAFAKPRGQRDTTAIDARLNELRGPTFGLHYAMVTTLLPALNKSQESCDKVLQQRDALVTAIGLELFKRKHGRYPETLTELVPTYLPALPLDVWSGLPLKYLPKGSSVSSGRPMIYSVGADKIDDGGLIGTPWDLTVAGMKSVWPAVSGDIPTRDWVLWPKVPTSGTAPAVRASEANARPSDNSLLRGLMPWSTFNP